MIFVTPDEVPDLGRAKPAALEFFKIGPGAGTDTASVDPGGITVLAITLDISNRSKVSMFKPSIFSDVSRINRLQRKLILQAAAESLETVGTSDVGRTPFRS